MWSLRKTKIKLWLFWENGTFKEDMLRNTLKTLKLQVDKTYWYIYHDLNYFQKENLGRSPHCFWGGFQFFTSPQVSSILKIK